MEFRANDEDNIALTMKDYGNALTKHEDVNASMNPKPGGKAFSVSQLDYQAYWTTTADKYTHWKMSIQQTMTKDDNVLHTSWKAFSTNALTNSKPWKAFSSTQMFDYSTYWMTLVDKYTHWERGIQETLTKDDNVFHMSWKAFSTKHEDVKNAVMNSKPWKALSSTDYQAYWTTLTDRYTHWERGIQQTMTKDDNPSWKAFSTLSRLNQSKNFRWSAVVTLLLLIITIFVSVGDRSPPHFVGDVNYVCESPHVIQPWQIKAFRPNWFGLFGGPGPITYKTKGSKGHRVSIVDIDRRDIEITIRVDDKSVSHRPVVLDNTVSCGEDLARCRNMGFGAATISVPPGKHTIRAEILNVNRTFRWEHERKRRVWWMVERCS